MRSRGLAAPFRATSPLPEEQFAAAAATAGVLIPCEELLLEVLLELDAAVDGPPPPPPPLDVGLAFDGENSSFDIISMSFEERSVVFEVRFSRRRLLAEAQNSRKHFSASAKPACEKEAKRERRLLLRTFKHQVTARVRVLLVSPLFSSSGKEDVCTRQ